MRNNSSPSSQRRPVLVEPLTPRSEEVLPPLAPITPSLPLRFLWKNVRTFSVLPKAGGIEPPSFKFPFLTSPPFYPNPFALCPMDRGGLDHFVLRALRQESPGSVRMICGASRVFSFSSSCATSTGVVHSRGRFAVLLGVLAGAAIPDLKASLLSPQIFFF